MPKMKIRKGDQVQVLSGKDRGARGEVIRAIPSEGRVVVRGVAMVKKAQKPNQMGQNGGIIEKESAIDVSNVALIDPKTDTPTRVGYRFGTDGKKVRYAKKSGEEI
ncbi:50S ribosomal protein L24 [Olsenella sp. oral taxon 807]|uniref:50S ribosomal protein L24 n=1 Tax=Olsenella sp. oral taxon 807 TaxID=712411 RepID=UPI00067A1CDE|nr:50S ribosomal protein L24 [Olsenella sp. oral taxon 807]